MKLFAVVLVFAVVVVEAPTFTATVIVTVDIVLVTLIVIEILFLPSFWFPTVGFHVDVGGLDRRLIRVSLTVSGVCCKEERPL